MIPFRSTSYNRISGERDANFLRNSAKLFNNRHNQGHAALTAHFFRLALGITGNKRTISARRGLRSTKCANEIIDLPLELVSLDETIDAHRAEKVSDSLPHTTCRNFLAQRKRRRKRTPISATQRTTKNVDHDGQAVAFVPATLTIRTQRQECAACDDVIRIGGAAALIVNAPTLRDRLAAASRHFNFAVSGRTSSHVDHNRRLIFSGKGDSNRVSAQHAFRAPQRRHQFGGIGHRPANHVALQGLQHVVTGDTVVIGIADADPAGTGLFGHVHCNFICLRANDQAQTIVAIDGGSAQRRAQNLDLRRRINQTFAEQIKVTRKTRHAMRIDTAQVSRSEHVGSLLRVRLGHTEVKKDASAELAQYLNGKYLDLDPRHAPPAYSRNLRTRAW